VRAGRLVIALVVLGVVAWTLAQLDWAVVGQQLSRARPGPLLAAAALVVLPLALRSLRARTLLSRVGHADIPAFRVAAVTVFGFSLSSLTPGGSGDLLRVAALRPYGVAPSLSAAIVVYERALDVAVMAALLGVALAVTWLPAGTMVAVLGVAAVATLAVAAAYALLRPAPERWIGRAPAPLRRWLPEPGALRPLLEPRVLGRALATTVLVFAAEALRPWLVIVALGVEAGLFEAWAIFTLAWGAGLVSMLPLGIGSWEAAAVWAFALYGVDPSTGAAGAVLLRAGVTLPALALGLLSFGWLRGAARERG
jgi:Mg2+-importing ATPase